VESSKDVKEGKCSEYETDHNDDAGEDTDGINVIGRLGRFSECSRYGIVSEGGKTYSGHGRCSLRVMRILVNVRSQTRCPF
jgi:hypothetical protein